jgi:hypothetical protein
MTRLGLGIVAFVVMLTRLDLRRRWLLGSRFLALQDPNAYARAILVFIDR